ncbi:protein indeterminate-domain 5, chloroplastic-like isoform X1 [Zingiber officinale]|uniref:Protein EARLY HEADING DATE 2 n=1 Tax=Zingiber officinale TaxID=94328 RepID=A0A8J5C3L5_ZINOF|nr:protein indeterminate-domain 5, chloroplastic-like isoform X1 [Zingiber officinale]KAG6470263.1 hypothetical protein ZIOFF_071328 [Zingiber officinale]
MAAASSSVPFFGIRDEDEHELSKQQSTTAAAPPPGSATALAPPKKKRNQPGNPNPDAEVIALSPKTLMATNRFICEVCNKGFQREQNLQLHRRGHNLPWKLKQKNPKEARRRVYLCPEPSCVHHDPSRALGDLTGIKKHFCRKHGEKKWKCDKCSKKYAVQSDWKAHSKTCGTREYRCDCGTLFSRRDSFITHRAFCDALAQESATRLPNGIASAGVGGGGRQFYGGSAGVGGGINLDLISPANPPQFGQLSSTTSLFRPSQSYLSGAGSGHDFNSLIQDMHSNTTAGASSTGNLYNLSFFSNNAGATGAGAAAANMPLPSDQFPNSRSSGGGLFPSINIKNNVPSLFVADPTEPAALSPALPQMSATALLQKAAQMGAAASNSRSSLLSGFVGAYHSETTQRAQLVDNERSFQTLMNSLGGGAGAFANNLDDGSPKLHHVVGAGTPPPDNGLTRDFLGVANLSVLESEMKSAFSRRSNNP